MFVFVSRYRALLSERLVAQIAVVNVPAAGCRSVSGRRLSVRIHFRFGDGSGEGESDRERLRSARQERLNVRLEGDQLGFDHVVEMCPLKVGLC